MYIQKTNPAEEIVSYIKQQIPPQRWSFQIDTAHAQCKCVRQQMARQLCDDEDKAGRRVQVQLEKLVFVFAPDDTAVLDDKIWFDRDAQLNFQIHTRRRENHQPRLYAAITQRRPCNIQQYFTAVKIFIFWDEIF